VYTLGAKYNPIKTIGFTTRYRDKDKNAINTILDFAKLINASVKCLYVKTSDSDVSSETIEDWKMAFKREPIEFIVFESEESNAAVLDFIRNENINVLTISIKEGFLRDCSKLY
jgi:ABC-type xylose transport system substrate-binding protein